VVLDISRHAGLSAEHLVAIRRSRLRTPLAFGGGIRQGEDLEALFDVGVDRFVLESIFLRDRGTVEAMQQKVGSQALIASIPFTRRGGNFFLAPHGNPTERLAHDYCHTVQESGLFSELLLLDADADGSQGRFSVDFAQSLGSLRPNSVIWFGGVGIDSAELLMKLPVTAGIAWGNPLFESESPLNHLRLLFEGPR
jgi:Imidazoleglycerol-phosphate synthase